MYLEQLWDVFKATIGILVVLSMFAAAAEMGTEEPIEVKCQAIDVC